MFKFKWAVFGFSIVNILAVFIVILCALPNPAPSQIGGNMLIEALGSPWVTILPFALVPIFFTLVSVCNKDIQRSEKAQANYRTRDMVISVISVIFAYIAWLMVDIASVDGGIGEKANISIMILVVVPLSFIMYVVGAYLPSITKFNNGGLRFSWTVDNPKVRAKTHNFASIMGMSCGAFSFVCAVLFHFVSIEWLGYVGVGVAILLLSLSTVLYSYFSFLHIVPLDERAITDNNVQEKFEEATTKLETIESVIDTHEELQKEVEEKIAEPIEKTEEGVVVTSIPTESTIEPEILENIKDTAEYVK